MTTDRDRLTARKLWRAARYADPVDAPEVEDVIADALAAERARVLAPVLAVAEELDAKARQCAVEADELPIRSERRMGLLGRILGMKSAAARIRLAAQDGEPE